MKLVEIISGTFDDGDYTERYVVMPNDIDMKEWWLSWRQWIEDIYHGGGSHKPARWVNFFDWLIKTVGEPATSDNIMKFNSDIGEWETL